ncbi:PAC2 family protein [Spelaeicoccus albus]|uniref:Proteasome assembly chaperone (PAC2) family protein n=1 Tax=Spelaeicoccus albus TaxID=1280376 RepID=A0A7Z0D3Y0_9MICO|nr:PAC2 family protein [Spelaeicoccus albus]NYI68424.1 proteasome assembly chaperone (PAC2) family protein [Spelaeicoccus albus]
MEDQTSGADQPAIPLITETGRAHARAEGAERDTVMIVAFEGWNDAGNAASAAVSDLCEYWDAEEITELDSDVFYDFQFTRPVVGRDADGVSSITWPGTRVFKASVKGQDLDAVIVLGVEPSFRWHRFVDTILSHGSSAAGIILVGALLADVPHSRPIPVSVSSENAELRETLDIEVNHYEGPTGVIGILSHEASVRGIPAVSVWAAVPSYVAAPPSPKAQLAITSKIEELLSVSIPQNELIEDARAWERGVNELAEEDEDVAAYIHQLEQVQDTADLPEASGEAIAREFEKYLRRNPPDGPKR